MFCINRSGWYHIKLRVPTDLVPIIGTAMIQRSLRTKQRRQANKLALELRDRLVPQFQRLRIERLSGTNDDQLKQLAYEWLPIHSTDRNGLKSPKQVLLSELIEAFLDDKSKQVDELTLLNMRHTYDLALFVLGDLSISQVDRNVCRRFRDTLLVLPPHTLKRHRDKSLGQVIALNENPMHPTTVNKNMRFLSTMFIWAEREGHIESNPARGLSISMKRKASSERKAYDISTLSHMLSHLPNSSDQPEHYWIPIVGYFTGMRVEEICQLRVEDIIVIDGITCFSITPDAGLLKTVNAERLVPMHPELDRLGFMEFVKARLDLRAHHLWPNLKKNRYGKFSSQFTKWFGRFKRAVGISDRLLTFHSLRHTFVIELKQAGVSEHMIAQLIGHSINSIPMGRYGKEYDVRALLREVQKIASLSPVEGSK